MVQEAIKKIQDQKGTGKLGRRQADIMAGPVAERLMEFCRQDEEFARAVVQGGSFEACMTAVAKNCGSALSDLEAYRRAVQFYFPGAEIRVKMTVDLNGDMETPEASERGVILDITSFL